VWRRKAFFDSLLIGEARLPDLPVAFGAAAVGG